MYDSYRLISTYCLALKRCSQQDYNLSAGHLDKYAVRATGIMPGSPVAFLHILWYCSCIQNLTFIIYNLFYKKTLTFNNVVINNLYNTLYKCKVFLKSALTARAIKVI